MTNERRKQINAKVQKRREKEVKEAEDKLNDEKISNERKLEKAGEQVP